VKFPDDVTILRGTEPDEYGDPNRANFQPVASVKGAILGLASLMLPPSADIRPLDRVSMRGGTYAVKDAPIPLGPPGKRTLWAVSLTRLPDGI
jgi:hypothetical protein